MPLHVKTLHRDAKILDCCIRGSLFPRVVAIIIATFFLIYCLSSKSDKIFTPEAVLIGMVTSLALYSGARIDFKCLSVRPPRWTTGFFVSLFSYIICIYILDKSAVTRHFGSFGVFINIAYLGAKIGCMNLGCCGIKCIKDKHLFGWSLRPRLQSFEVCATGTILLLGVILFFGKYEYISGFVLISGHGALRVFAGKYRFHYKKTIDFIKEPSGGGIICTGIASLLFAI